ncbi:MAG TPA: biotin--[acetyl-CoA-carboxylase] ligase [Candidatus Acidoferrum sp.]|nr:biotin--[acetyl-CoA-carboxylase] ligase [Candidatus Acidoferrum sp.]
MSGRMNDDAWLAEDALCIDLIRRELSTASVGYEIRLFRELSSTVEAVRVLAESGAREGTVVLAETQHAGRGLFGPPWFPPERANLYAAVLFRPRMPRHSVGVFALIASLALTDAITTEGPRAHVRWPNEVLVDGRRLGRTLTTVEPAAAIADYVIVGVEVNRISEPPRALARHLSGPWRGRHPSILERPGRAAGSRRGGARGRHEPARTRRWRG